MSEHEKPSVAEDRDADRPELPGNAGTHAGWPTPERRRGGGGKWVFLLAVVLVLAVQVYLMRGCQQSTVDLAGKTADQIAQAFSRNVTHEFLSTAPSLTADSRHLVATVTMTEVMTREVKKSIPLWPDEIQSATLNVRVTYNYAVPFQRERWDLVLTHHPGQGGDRGVLICDVIAPAVEPVLPPAPDTSEMTIRRYNSALTRFDQAVVDSLILDMTPRFSQKSYSYLPLVRELSRNQVKHFVQSWILISENAQLADEVVVRVSFRDELEAMEAGKSERLAEPDSLSRGEL